MTIAAANTARNFPGIAFQLPDGGMSEEQFYRFCLLNPDLRIERTWDKFIVIMPPTNSTAQWSRALTRLSLDSSGTLGSIARN
ncbi:MAG: hypothetical protein ACOYNO_00165 [Saprospiraceae bacterium]|jgi:hypothetical protein